MTNINIIKSRFSSLTNKQDNTNKKSNEYITATNALINLFENQFANKPVDDLTPASFSNTNIKLYQKLNKCLVLGILDIAQESIYIHTKKMFSSVYSDKQVVNKIIRWLKEDSKRKINILLKEAPVDYKYDENNILFVRGNYKDISEQIIIRVAKCQDVASSSVNILCADESIYKTKKIDNENETIAFNFDETQVAKFREIINSLFSDDYSILYQNNNVSYSGFSLIEMFKFFIAPFRKSTQKVLPKCENTKISNILQSANTQIDQVISSTE